MKKSISIENLVRWAYRDELPKEQAQAASFLHPDTFAMPWNGITRTGLQGMEVQEPDIRNRYGLVPDFTAQRSPHLDAVRVYHQVRALGDLQLTLPEDWNPLIDLGDLGPEGPAAVVRGLRRLSLQDINGHRHLRDAHAPTYLIQKTAIMGPPEWRSEIPARKNEKLSDGRIRYFVKQVVVTEQGSFEIEVDGFDYSKNLPKAGAYKKTFLDPDPAEAVVARGEYEIWHAALSVLAEELVGRLDDYDVTQTDRPARPWEDGDKPAPRILTDGTVRHPIVREPRPVAGPPPYRGVDSRAWWICNSCGGTFEYGRGQRDRPKFCPYCRSTSHHSAEQASVVA